MTWLYLRWGKATLQHRKYRRRGGRAREWRLDCGPGCGTTPQMPAEKRKTQWRVTCHATNACGEETDSLGVVVPHHKWKQWVARKRIICRTLPQSRSWYPQIRRGAIIDLIWVAPNSYTNISKPKVFWALFYWPSLLEKWYKQSTTITHPYVHLD